MVPMLVGAKGLACYIRDSLAQVTIADIRWAYRVESNYNIMHAVYIKPWREQGGHPISRSLALFTMLVSNDQHCTPTAPGSVLTSK